MISKGKKTAVLTVLASSLVFGLAGCANMNKDGTKMNDGMNTKMYNTNKEINDLQLGRDRNQGSEHFRDAGDNRRGMNGVNGWGNQSANNNRNNSYNNGMNGMNGTNGMNSSNNNHNNTRMEESKELADQITAMGPFDWASVMLTDHNAYVAVKMKQGQNLETGDLNAQISNQVKSTRPDVNNVYVSSNPDMASRFQQYGEQIRQGHPISGFISEFNTTMTNMFPTNASNR